MGKRHLSLKDRGQRRLLAFLSIAVLGLSGFAAWRDFCPEWRSWQQKYRRASAEREQNPQRHAEILEAPLEVLQIMLPGSRRVDRCTTCHAGTEDPGMTGAPLPLAFHRGAPVHRPAQFGCTCCHGGDGSALNKRDAHGRDPSQPASFLPRPYIRATCGRCHWEGEIPGVPELARGRAVAAEYGCHGCHRFDGYGGRIGPELSFEGASGHMPEWHERHFIRPSAVTAGSPMPVFGFSPQQRRDLTFFLLSLVPRDRGSPWFRLPVLPTAANGAALAHLRRCGACHAANGIAAGLGRLREGRSSQFISKLLTFTAMKPGSAMPSYAAEEAAGRAIAEFLASATAEQLASLSPRPRRHSAEEVVAGARARFIQVGCVGCHGRTAEGGLANPNSQGGQVPALVHLADDYTKEEVVTIVRRGRLPPLQDPAKPAPPLYMPTWSAMLTAEEILEIVEYPWSLSARNKSEAWQ